MQGGTLSDPKIADDQRGQGSTRGAEIEQLNNRSNNSLRTSVSRASTYPRQLRSIGGALHTQLALIRYADLDLDSFLTFAQRAFIAADMAALPCLLIFLFFGVDTLAAVDRGRPGPLGLMPTPTPVNNAFACWSLNISLSISAMMLFVSMKPPLDQHKRREMPSSAENGIFDCIRFLWFGSCWSVSPRISPTTPAQ